MIKPSQQTQSDVAAELGTGKRFNEGKLRYDLVNPIALEGMVSILTHGAEKYGDRNWEKGMKWSNVISSLKRHLAAIEKGEDYDQESGKLHIDHLQCNAHFLSAYYKLYPQGDDRFHITRPKPKIGLDIDEVLCNWVGAWCAYYNMPTPTAWFFDGNIVKKFEKMKEKGILDSFYADLEPLLKPEDLPFEPHAYVTSRPVSSEITTEWLRKHGFPIRPVITVKLGQSKADVIKDAGIDIFVDDRYDNFEELNRKGICCFLWDAPHNQRYEVGFKRIKSLKELL